MASSICAGDVIIVCLDWSESRMVKIREMGIVEKYI